MSTTIDELARELTTLWLGARGATLRRALLRISEQNDAALAAAVFDRLRQVDEQWAAHFVSLCATTFEHYLRSRE